MDGGSYEIEFYLVKVRANESLEDCIYFVAALDGSEIVRVQMNNVTWNEIKKMVRE